MTTPPVAQPSDIKRSQGRAIPGGPPLTGSARPADAHAMSPTDCALRVQQPFHQLARLVQQIESRLAAVRSSDQGAILAQHRRAMLAAMHALGAQSVPF